MSVYVSGPVNIAILRYGQVKFIFFADRHQSFEGTCTDPICDNEMDQNQNSNCYTVDGAIAKIIHNAYVDIYLESPFNIPKIRRLQNPYLIQQTHFQ